ncbi:peptidoglycan DD-metalloendopeptidase family protein [Fibrobacter sp.]|uniref:peptidoglycan DD-metalloendopeptidase family protein n=1 Tax=Fibrobacter sp. TaxID=35828 RepID=UPI0025B7DF0B|nr:peptidoglycan DD-metalloendopeptidase family protein [Fibrobacter sp.]MBS7272458.1 peptidoglycan DD-metalloendopeptidase family protein [Fibrobacter sp.]MDD7497444.1 peptidoglycan DD-metalloendopeptidase family protein [Fibrobacter sp.]MDY5724888.1 peptidoglycan DD-metalloendopeptidase family protein [Fibrobacter sp.]
MKWTTLTLTALLPFALFAKEIDISSTSETLIENGQENAAKEIIAVEDSSQKWKATDSLNLKDAGNSPVISNEVASINSLSDSLTDSPKTDSLALINDESTEDGNEEAGAESEEAEAELEADMAEADSATVDALQKLTLDMTTAFVPSASRRVSAPYGIRTYRMHRGVDLGLCHGEDRTIVAAFKGTVVKVRNQGRRKGYGKYVILDHGNGLTTLYAHLASWQVNVGDTLQAGDTIGVGGNTGRSFGAHLHFEMRFNGNYIDPATVFNFEEGTFLNAMTEIDEVKLQLVEADFQKELAKHRYYKVRRGDCLGKIARKYGISIKRLKQLNGIKGNMIRPGQVLRCS